MTAQELFEQLGEVIYEGGGDLDVILEQACYGQIQRDIATDIRVDEMNGVKQVIIGSGG